MVDGQLQVKDLISILQMFDPEKLVCINEDGLSCILTERGVCEINDDVHGNFVCIG